MRLVGRSRGSEAIPLTPGSSLWRFKASPCPERGEAPYSTKYRTEFHCHFLPLLETPCSTPARHARYALPDTPCSPLLDTPDTPCQTRPAIPQTLILLPPRSGSVQRKRDFAVRSQRQILCCTEPSIAL